MAAASYLFSGFRLAPAERSLCRGSEAVKLGGRAFDMLLALVERRERTVGKFELMDLVWPNLVVEENNLQVQMVVLRKLLGHPAIATIPGRGYRFVLPVQVEGDPEATPGGRADASRPTPSPAAPFGAVPVLYGREADLAALLELIEGHPLVVVAGPGGIGKTRLAESAVAARAGAGDTGTWWVELASLAEPSLIAHAVAQAVGAPPTSPDPFEAIERTLRDRADGLVVLDNAEHLLEGVAGVVARLRVALPRLRILVTSQEVLHVADEQVFRPDPLAVPDADDPAGVDACAAVRLFVDRARSADRRFVLDAGSREAVADICRRLDGIPLAIELAAARLPLLGIDGLRSRLDDRFRLLTSGPRRSLRRHQTLRAALEWSHGLLLEREQAVLRRLAVFAGGFTLAAAQHVAVDDDSIDAWDVLDHLGALVDKSLVRVDGPATPRYRLLETTRLFALERLIESGEADRARGRHLEHVLEGAEQAVERMLIGDPAGLAFFDRERDDVLLALAWPGGAGAEDLGLRLAAATRWFWPARGLLPRGIEAMQRALARSTGEPAVARCRVLGSLAHYESLSGRGDRAAGHIEQAVREARLFGDAACLSLALSGAGFIALGRDDVAEADARAAEALELARRLGDGHELGNALTLRSAVHRRAGETDRSRDAQLEAVALRERLGHPWSEAVGRINLADIAIGDGDAATARAHLQRVLALTSRVDSEQIAVYTLGIAAQYWASVGEHEMALGLDATRATHARRIGLRDELDAVDRRRLEAACAALDAATAEGARRDGASCGLEDGLRRVRQRLAQAQP